LSSRSDTQPYTYYRIQRREIVTDIWRTDDNSPHYLSERDARDKLDYMRHNIPYQEWRIIKIIEQALAD
jgi:hypothetical protein